MIAVLKSPVLKPSIGAEELLDRVCSAAGVLALEIVRKATSKVDPIWVFNNFERKAELPVCLQLVISWHNKWPVVCTKC